MQTTRRYWLALGVCVSVVVIIILAAISVLADGPQPVLTIAPLGSNSFLLTITNEPPTSTNNYEWHWTPGLGSADDAWQLLAEPSPDTNFAIDAGEWPVGFFQASIEQFYDGVPDYKLADPNNPSLGALSITIDSPTNGANLN